jgi:hypothetical protein
LALSLWLLAFGHAVEVLNFIINGKKQIAAGPLHLAIGHAIEVLNFILNGKKPKAKSQEPIADFGCSFVLDNGKGICNI